MRRVAFALLVAHLGALPANADGDAQSLLQDRGRASRPTRNKTHIDWDKVIPIFNADVDASTQAANFKTQMLAKVKAAQPEWPVQEHLQQVNAQATVCVTEGATDLVAFAGGYELTEAADETNQNRLCLRTQVNRFKDEVPLFLVLPITKRLHTDYKTKMDLELLFNMFGRQFPMHNGRVGSCDVCVDGNGAGAGCKGLSMTGMVSLGAGQRQCPEEGSMVALRTAIKHPRSHDNILGAIFSQAALNWNITVMDESSGDVMLAANARVEFLDANSGGMIESVPDDILDKAGFVPSSTVAPAFVPPTTSLIPGFESRRRAPAVGSSS